MGLRKDPSAYERGQFSFHLDLEALPRTPRVDDDAVHERPEIGDHGSAVVLRVSVASHRLGKCVDGLDVTVEGRRMQRDGDGGLVQRI